MKYSQEISIDEIDIRLLDLLQADAAMSNQSIAQRAHVSAPTALRRIKRLREMGFIERQIAVLHPDRMASALGHGLQALVEITLEHQGNEHLEAFEKRAIADPAVQQCYRVSPGPDFILVVHSADMPSHLALTQRLFTSDANVRNVKAFFSIKRAKFDPRLPLLPLAQTQKPIT